MKREHVVLTCLHMVDVRAGVLYSIWATDRSGHLQLKMAAKLSKGHVQGLEKLLVQG